MKTRKELIEEYRRVKPQAGVFQIKNKENQKVFIDNSVNMESLWNRHQTELKLGTHRNTELQKDWDNNGSGSLIFEILSVLKVSEDGTNNIKKELKELQELVIEELNIGNESLY